jgi:hypothetical protein
VRRLDEESRRLERFAKGPSVEALIIDERARSYQRSVFGWEPPPSDENSERLADKPGF